MFQQGVIVQEVRAETIFEGSYLEKGGSAWRKKGSEETGTRMEWHCAFRQGTFVELVRTGIP